MKSTISIVIVLLLAVTIATAKDKKTNPYSYSKASVENLQAGLDSDNSGLKKSSIYMIGEYKVRELGKSLISLLDTEPDPSARILIAFSLYYLSDEEGMAKIKLQSYIDNDPKVRVVCSAIYDEFSKMNDVELVQLTGKE